MSETRIGVIGAGVMGSGIAQTLATAGIRTVCTDIDENLHVAVTEELVLEDCPDRVDGEIGFDPDFLAQHGQITEGALGIQIIANDGLTMLFQPDGQVEGHRALT